MVNLGGYRLWVHNGLVYFMNGILYVIKGNINVIPPITLIIGNIIKNYIIFSKHSFGGWFLIYNFK